MCSKRRSSVKLNPLKPSGHYMYRQFNIQQFYVLPTQCICVFCVDLRTNSDYFPTQYQLTGFYDRDGEYMFCVCVCVCLCVCIYMGRVAQSV